MNILQWPLECLMGDAFKLFEYLSHLQIMFHFFISTLVCALSGIIVKMD